MNTSNPIIPPGSPLGRNRSERNPKLLFTVFAILGLHLALLAGLLIQGCKREEGDTSAGQEIETNALPGLAQEELPAGERLASEPPEQPSTVTPPQPQTPQPQTQQAETTPPQDPVIPNKPAPSLSSTGVVAEPGAFGREAGDLPPAPLPGAARPGPKPQESTPAANGPHTVYVVKTGDNLTRIARNHGTTVSALRAANGLKTDRILVGQKLKVPAGNSPSNGAPPR